MSNPARLSHTSLIVGLLGMAASIICWMIDGHKFFTAWLISWFYWFSIAIGCLGFAMIYRLTGGLWGESLERILLSAGRTIGTLAVLFIPVLFGMHHLYSWAHADFVNAEPKVQHKHVYLNVPFWCVRTVFYFVTWFLLSWLIAHTNQENSRRISALGLVVIFLTVTFAAIDWIMSLEPLWYSTVYGMIILSGQGLCAMAFSLLATHLLRKTPRRLPPLTEKALNDQGSLLLTTSVVWTYTTFVQWLIIWIGNVPETVTWYTSRSAHGWETVAWLVVIGQFGIPFQLLLFQVFKTQTRNLAILGAIVLLTHLIDVYWLIVPAFHHEAFAFNWMVIPTTAAVGGVWLTSFIWQLRGQLSHD